MTEKENLERYELVNNTSSLKELAEVIRGFSSEGMIAGRNQLFDSEKMAKYCEEYSLVYHNVLTRKYGIRQQAMMLLFYGDDY